MDDYVDLVFTGPPGPDPSTCGFIEAEDAAGKSIKLGEWLERDDGRWVLRVWPEGMYAPFDAGDKEEWTTFEGLVNVGDKQPFCMMKCGLGKDPVFAMKMAPATMLAMGVRAIQAALEAERDAGLIAYVEGEFSDDVGLPQGDTRIGIAGAMLDGMRRHREQFDPEAGSMRKLGPDDPSELG